MTPTEVAVISIFGRGHWLAVELTRAGVPVTLVDVSADQGPWTEVDQVGPFGGFKSDFQLENNLVPQKQGLSLWLNDGPVEFGSLNVDYRLKKMGVSTLVKKYVQSAQAQARDLQKLSFDENWPAQLSHVWNATISANSFESINSGKKADLFGEFFRYRHSEVSGLSKSLAWCEKNQVRVIKAKHIKDLAYENKGKLSGLEIQAEKSGVLKAEKFIWCLSQAETRKLSEKVRGTLFPAGVIYPEWAWIRFRVKIEDSQKLQHWLPDHVVILNDLHLPWSHENFVVMQRAEQEKGASFDCWLKIPHAQRFQKTYLHDMATRLEELLQHKISGANIEILEWPLEAKMDEQRLGPNPFVVYREHHHKPKTRDWNNVHFTGPEHWESSSYQGKRENEKELFAEMKSWWDKKMEALAKRLKERNS
jgi:hypothetical protein